MANGREGLRGALQIGGQFLQGLGQQRLQQRQEERQFQQKLTLADLLGGKKEKRTIAAEERAFKRQQEIISQKAKLDEELDQSLIDLRKAQTKAAGKEKKLPAFSFFKALGQSGFNVNKKDTDATKFNKVQNRINLFRSAGITVPIEEIEQARRVANNLDREEKFQLLNFIGIVEEEAATVQDAVQPGVTTGPNLPEGTKLDRATAAQILQEAGGDKDRAREIARERGLKF